MKLFITFLKCCLINYAGWFAIGPMASTAKTQGLSLTFIICGGLLIVAADFMFFVELYKSIKGALNE